jgi:hypothetical protein
LKGGQLESLTCKLNEIASNRHRNNLRSDQQEISKSISAEMKL